MYSTRCDNVAMCVAPVNMVRRGSPRMQPRRRFTLSRWTGAVLPLCAAVAMIAFGCAPVADALIAPKAITLPLAWWRTDTHSTEKPVGRYGHASVYHEEMVWMFGGYRHDKNPIWLDDTWYFDTGRSQWERVHQSNGPLPRSGHTICAYKGRLLLFGGDDGGQRNRGDSQSPSYVAGHFFDDMWVRDIRVFSERARRARADALAAEEEMAALNAGEHLLQNRNGFADDGEEDNIGTRHGWTDDWQRIAPAESETGDRWPSSRYEHVAFVLGDAMYVFGGIAAQNKGPSMTGTQAAVVRGPMNDLWRLPLERTGNSWTEWLAMAWERLATGVEKVDGFPSPSRRHAHAAVVSGGQAYVFGGRGPGRSDGTEGETMGDLWVFRPEAVGIPRGLPWVKLEQAVNVRDKLWPGRRMGHSMMAVLGSPALFGGVLCTEAGCKGNSELWIYDVYAQKWASKTPSGGGPHGRFYFSFAAGYANVTTSRSGDSIGARTIGNWAAYLFGGESYEPYGYWNDVWKLSVAISQADSDMESGRSGVKDTEGRIVPHDADAEEEEQEDPLEGVSFFVWTFGFSLAAVAVLFTVWRGLRHTSGVLPEEKRRD
eukprot:Opistho-2@83253